MKLLDDDGTALEAVPGEPEVPDEDLIIPPDDQSESGPVALVEGSTSARSGAGVYTIVAEGQTATGAINALEITVRLGGRRGTPYRVLSRRTVAGALFEVGASADASDDE